MVSLQDVSVATQHDDILHDAQMDYYGKRLATCSSDRTIKVFDVENGAYTLKATLRGHEGAVWQVSWAHPKFGSILASCSYDKKVHIWKEESPGQWVKLYTHQVHESSVNSVVWGPHEYGLDLVCGSSDGSVSILSSAGNGTWTYEKWNAHVGGCNAVNWAPVCESGALVQPNAGSSPKRIITAGCDNLLKIWKYDDTQKKWLSDVEEYCLKKHEDWVRDVAWCPNLGLPGSRLASCGQDSKVFIWTLDANTNEWHCKSLEGFTDVVWRVSWSVTGHVLSVTSFDKVSLWKESPEGEWSKIQEFNNQKQQ